MQELVTLVGGQLEIESYPGHGTTIFVQEKIDQENKKLNKG
jgi:hypothetical protein